MDRIDLLRLYTRVVETGSFTRASELMQVPRSTVSTAIQQLEQRLSARLLNRSTRHVAPTPDGQAFYERSLRLLAEYEEVEGLFRQSAAVPQGLLRINVPSRVASHVLAPALPDFLARYPGVELEMGVTDRAVDLVQEGVDCVIRVGVLPESSLVALPLGELAMGNYASPAYLAAHGVPRRLADLGAHLMVTYASTTTGRGGAWEYVEAGVPKALAMRSRVTVNSADSYIACCLAGLGLIQVPAYDAAAHVAAGQLVAVLPDERAAPMPLTLLYPHRRQRAARLQAFVEWSRELLKARVLPAGAQASQP